ncbi:MAG: hypothetical protein ABIL09_29190 [Gemmatimonadota bacterium]
MTDASILSLADHPWTFSAQGRYLLVEDPRGLHQVYHPWDTADAGDFGALTARVEVPAGWVGPVFLNLYAGDTYVAEGWEEAAPRWTHTYASCHQMPGHRFKQVLVDGAVVWDQDVGDPEVPGYFQVDLGDRVHAGQPFELTLRVLDKVATATRLPGDAFHLGIWSWDGLGDPGAAAKLYTRVFWGDLALSAGAPLAWSDNPARRPLELHPVRPPPAPAPERAEHRFSLSAPAGLPPEGYPVTWGLPFAMGQLRRADQVVLVGPAGEPVPLQTTVLQSWSDGSIHWLLLDFAATPAGANQGYTLRYGTAVRPAPAAPGLSVAKTADGVRVDTGALSFAVRRGAASLAESILLVGDDAPLGEAVEGELVSRDGWVHTTFAAVPEEVVVEAAGPERATVLCRGRLVAGDGAFGRFTCRLHAYRGRPYLRLLFRVFNDTEAPAQLVEQLRLRLRTPLTRGEAVLGDERLTTDDAETGRLLVRQHRADGYEVFAGNDARRGAGARWQGPVALEEGGRGVAGQVRHFRQLYPKRMWAGQGGQLVFDLFVPTIEYEQYVMTRGEARRHEALLCFYRGAAEQSHAAFAAFEAPPILVSPEWYARQQAFGLGAALTPEQFPGLYRWMAAPGAPSLECTVPMGLRNWPDGYSDSVYNAYRGTWSNLYQEVDYGAYIVALLAGRRDFFDYAEAYQGHFMDLDICHYHPDPAWVGASYGISPYHTGHQPYALNAPLGGLFLLYHLTGDPDAREAAVGIAEWLHALNVGMGSGSGRAVGWPLRSAVVAYENTGDAKYLEAGGKLAEFALASLDPRRGFFSEPPATWQYRGGVPTMNAILAAGLMHYWRVTGDERVGRACADIACNMAYSWMSPTEPGRILGSDPLQQVYLTGYAMQDILPLFWGYELTGDEAFLEKGAAVMRESILPESQRGVAFGLSRYWEMQDILYYYGLYRERHPE